MSNTIKVQFSLECWKRYDEEAKALVGYIPSLRLYSQGRDDEELKKALSSAAEMFIVSCYGKNILGKVLRDRGMTQATGAHTAIGATDFIAVGVVAEFDSHYEKAFEVNVPIELVAAQEVAATCRLQ